MRTQTGLKISKAHKIFVADCRTVNACDLAKYLVFFEQDMAAGEPEHLSTYVISQCIHNHIDPEIYLSVIPLFTDLPRLCVHDDYRAYIEKFSHARDKLKQSEFKQSQKIRRLLLDIARSEQLLLALYYCFAFEWHKNPDSTRMFYEIDEAILKILHNKYLYDALRENHIKSTMPVVYKRVTDQIGVCYKTRESTLASLANRIKSLTINAVKSIKINHRNKSVYSILDKMKRKHLALEEIVDKSAMRIIVDSTADCYQVETIIYQHFFPERKYHKNYIENPKDNGYQSIHLVIHEPTLGLVECQIRSKSMHENAVKGKAAHAIYKSQDGSISTIDTAMLDRFLSQGDRMNIALSDYVYVLTPKNQIIELPNPSTPIDLAYALHTDLGHQCAGALINGEISALNAKLSTGDIVEIINNKNHKPPRHWLDSESGSIFSRKARKKIQQFHNIQFVPEYADESMIMRLREIGDAHGVNTGSLHHLARLNNFRHTVSFLKFLKNKTDEYIKNILLPHKPKLASNTPTHDKLKVNLANCCHPVLDDDIVGYISIKGCFIHRVDCMNLIKQSDHRKLNLAWSEIASETPKLVFSILTQEPLSGELKSLLVDCHAVVQSTFRKNHKFISICAIQMPPYMQSFIKICNFAAHHPDIKVRRHGANNQKHV